MAGQRAGRTGIETELSVSLLLASHAVRTRGRKESATALLASAVASVLSSDGTADTVEQTRDEETRASGPHKGEGLDTQMGSLAVALEGIATLDKNGANRGVSRQITVRSPSLYIRHEAGGDDLEGQGEPGQETGQVASNARAHGQQTGEKGERSKEQADDDEGEHEP